MNTEKEYKKYRLFHTLSGKLVICGKNAEQNESVVKLADNNEWILHTKAAGSPFCVIKDESDSKDLKETANICAKYSRDWKKNKKDVEVHAFRGKEIFKEKNMPIGTFGVKKARKIIAKKANIEAIK